MDAAYSSHADEQEPEPDEDERLPRRAGPEDELIRLEGARRARQRALAAMQSVPRHESLARTDVAGDPS